jgi:hypothetical protein
MFKDCSLLVLYAIPYALLIVSFILKVCINGDGEYY